MEEIEKPFSALQAPPSLACQPFSINIIEPNDAYIRSSNNSNTSTPVPPSCPQIDADGSDLKSLDGFLQPRESRVHKHVSMRYGMEFLSQVTLISRSASLGQKQLGIESIPKEVLNLKILNFLKSIIYNPSLYQKLVDSFQVLQKEMNLSIRRSRNSFGSSNCSKKKSINSFKSNSKGHKCLDQSGSNESIKQNMVVPGMLGRAKSSGMSKFNRISIADAININKLELLKEIEPIKSNYSIESESITQIKSREDLVSDPNESRCSDEDLPAISLELKKGAKKISIMICEEIESGSSLFSEEQIINPKQLNLPELPISSKLIDDFFDTTSPFLINLALCFLFKCLSKGCVTLDEHNLGWLLGISTVVAYKIYYDETIEGLMDFFAEVLKQQMDGLAKLERWFLSTVNYELVVSSQQYQNMMMELLSASEKSSQTYPEP